MRWINFVIVVIISFINATNTVAVTYPNSIFLENEKPILTSSNKELGKVSVYSIYPTNQHFSEIIEQVLFLQKSLLINKKPIQEVTDFDVRDGFLVEEMDSVHLKEALMQDRGSIIVAYADQQKRSTNQLVGYAILRLTKYFFQNNKSGHLEYTFSISEHEWKNIVSNSIYIYELAVHPQYRRKGIGKLILNACQKQYKNWLYADVIYWPKPFVNELSYQLFLKNDFLDIGELYVKKSPKFRPFKSKLMAWSPGAGHF